MSLEEARSEIVKIMIAKHAFAVTNLGVSLATFLSLYAPRRVWRGCRGWQNQISLDRQGPSAVPQHVWAYNFINTLFTHARQDAAASLFLDIALDRKHEDYWNDFSRIVSTLLGRIEGMASGGMISQTDFMGAIAETFRQVSQDDIRRIMSSAQTIASFQNASETMVDYRRCFKSWWVCDDAEDVEIFSPTAAAKAKRAQAVGPGAKRRARRRKKNKDAEKVRARVTIGTGWTTETAGSPLSPEFVNEMNTSPASYKRFQKFAFVDRLLRFYLQAVEMLRNDIRSQLQAFDYTGDGNILRHFVKEALRRVTPKLSALEIQTLHDAGCSMIRTYNKKTGEERRTGGMDSSS